MWLACLLYVQPPTTSAQKNTQSAILGSFFKDGLVQKILSDWCNKQSVIVVIICVSQAFQLKFYCDSSVEGSRKSSWKSSLAGQSGGCDSGTQGLLVHTLKSLSATIIRTSGIVTRYVCDKQNRAGSPFFWWGGVLPTLKKHLVRYSAKFAAWNRPEQFTPQW